MISLARPFSRPVAAPDDALPGASTAPAGPEDLAYDRRFWLAYASNFTAMVTVVLLYRYADLVRLLGGGEFELGWIVGLGMVGAILARFVLGGAIDQYGAHRAWMLSLAVMAGSCFAHLALTTCHGPAIFLLRLLFAMGVAGTFATVMIWLGRRVSDVRMAELFAMLGSGGFIGMVVGTHLGDGLVGAASSPEQAVRWTFLTAGGLSVAALLFAWVAGWGLPPEPRRRARPLLAVLRRYHPGAITVMAVGAGMALSLTPTFLRPFAVTIHAPEIAIFFTPYALTAVATRICTRRLGERIGLRALIVSGTAVTAVSVVLLSLVDNPIGLILPGVVLGIGHALMLPPVFAAGSQPFPRRYRGTGVMFIMAAYDVGTLVGAPLAGAILRVSRKIDLPAYPTMFTVVAVLTVLIGAYYALSRSPARSRRRLPPPAVRIDSPSPPVVVLPDVSTGVESTVGCEG